MAKAKGNKRGAVGEQVFEQVRKLVTGDKVSVTKAFEMLADKTGGNKGTIAANYYRVARKKGLALRPRGPRAAAAGRGKASAVLGKAQGVIRELAALIKQQETQIARLQAENSRYGAIRKLISKAG